MAQSGRVAALARGPRRSHSRHSADRHRCDTVSLWLTRARMDAPADTVSLVLGLGGGLAIVAGCFAGGALADRMHKPMAYALACALGLAACVAMAASPRTASGYALTTLLYTFALGMSAAAFTGLVLAIIG